MRDNIQGEIIGEILLFLKKNAGIESENVSLTDGLESDLGISGDDASDLILAFSNRFGVDISGFQFYEYFHAEPSFFSLRKTKKTKELTIESLLKAAQSKILV
jgi:acyl carrier protein